MACALAIAFQSIMPRTRGSTRRNAVPKTRRMFVDRPHPRPIVTAFEAPPHSERLPWAFVDPPDERAVARGKRTAKHFYSALSPPFLKGAGDRTLPFSRRGRDDPHPTLSVPGWWRLGQASASFTR